MNKDSMTPTPIPEVAARLAKYEAVLRETGEAHLAFQAGYGPPRSRPPRRVEAHCADLRALLADHASLTAERDRMAGALEPFARESEAGRDAT